MQLHKSHADGACDKSQHQRRQNNAQRHPALAAGLLLFAGWRLLRGRGVRMAAALSAVLLTGGLLTNTLAMRGVTTVTALDAGNGAAVLLERDGRAALVVTGESAGGRMGRIGTMLKRRGIRQLDFLLFPDSNEQALFDIGLLLGRVEAARVLYDPDGKNAYQAEAFTREEQRLLLGETGVSFWEPLPSRPVAKPLLLSRAVRERGPSGIPGCCCARPRQRQRLCRRTGCRPI